MRDDDLPHEEQELVESWRHGLVEYRELPDGAKAVAKFIMDREYVLEVAETARLAPLTQREIELMVLALRRGRLWNPDAVR